MSSNPVALSQDKLLMVRGHVLTLKKMTAGPAGQQGVALCLR
ncbi:MAG TPA: hypothetical protein VF068_13725 [Rubrobacter sp.]